MSRLLEEYNNQIKQDLKSKLGLDNIFEVPKLQKIILNMGVGEGKDDSKQLKQNQKKQYLDLKLERVCPWALR